MRFAIIGYGRIGKRHALVMDANRECDWVAVCDLHDPESDAAADIPVPYFDDPEQMLEEGPDCDVVCICTPNGLHATHALLALKYGKHVLIEKPMTLRKTEAEKVIHTALSESKQVFCVMQNRYSPPAQWLKSIIDRQALGEIYKVDIQCYWNRDERYYESGNHPWHGTEEMDGGTLFTQFSHFVDIMYWMFGDIEQIRADFEDYAHADQTEFEDSGTIQFRFLDGAMGSLSYSTAAWDSNFESTLTVIGEKGTVKIGGQYMERLEYLHADDVPVPDLDSPPSANKYEGYKGSANNHPLVYENVIDVLKGRKPIKTNALEGMKVVEIIERIYGSNS